jgi:hypothetical protein
MAIPVPIKAVIGKVTTNGPGNGWDIALEPDCTTWLTMHDGEAKAMPCIGDTVTIQPPYIIDHDPQFTF